jgi:hypothetical protein
MVFYLTILLGHIKFIESIDSCPSTLKRKVYNLREAFTGVSVIECIDSSKRLTG